MRTPFPLAVVLFTLAQHTLAAALDDLHDARAYAARRGAVDAPQLLRRQDDDASQTGAPPPAATPQLAFPALTTLTTCTSTSIRWRYFGPTDADMSLSITNRGVDQTSPSTASTGPVTYTDFIQRRAPPLVSETGSATPTSGAGGSGSNSLFTLIAPGVIASDQSYIWESVAVPQGYYMLLANFPGWEQAFRSSSFLVRNGTDISCLSAIPPSGTSGGSSTTAPSSTNSSAPSATDSGTPLPVSGSSVNKGAIAGGVVGGLAIVAAAVAAFLFLRYASTNKRRGGGAGSPSNGFGIMGKWGNLGSFDSTRSSPGKTSKAKSKLYNGSKGGIGAASTASYRSQRHPSNAESLGPILSVQMDAVPYRNNHVGDSDEDMKYRYSPYDEKYQATGPFSDGGQDGDIYGSTLRAPEAQGNRQISNSSSHTGRRVSHSGVSPSPQPDYQSTSSVDLYPPQSPTYASASSPRSPPSPTGIPSNPANIAPAKRTPRKPVPSYNPSDPSIGYSMPDVPNDVRDSDMPVIPHLAHKDSHGSLKQMHYLIPDPLPEQKH